MNIKGLFEYDKLKLAKDNLEAELKAAKETDTELTKENDELHSKVLILTKEITDLKNKLGNMQPANEMRWEYVMIHTTEGSLACWLPTNGTAKEILSKYPAIFPEFVTKKRVPEV